MPKKLIAGIPTEISFKSFKNSESILESVADSSNQDSLKVYLDQLSEQHPFVGELAKSEILGLRHYFYLDILTENLDTKKAALQLQNSLISYYQGLFKLQFAVEASFCLQACEITITSDSATILKHSYNLLTSRKFAKGFAFIDLHKVICEIKAID